MATVDGIHQFLSKLELKRLGRLVLNSRFTVEGQLQGAHRSPLKGFSIEFADYRQYAPGDDLRHLDWRVFGRSDRLYIRQYEEESNLRVYLFIDGSKSMTYSLDGPSKYRFACRLAAALAYVTALQHDSVGLTICNAETVEQIPVKSGLAHLRLLANTMAAYIPDHEANLARNLCLLAEAIPRRALIVVVSDLFDDTQELRRALALLRKRKHDVIVYHVLDRAEIDFPFRFLGNFEDLETGDRLVINPRDVKEAYQDAVIEFLKDTRSYCNGLDIDYNLVTTETDVPRMIRRHLNRRQGKKG